ncbi:MAG: hypothetical protein KF773_04705 [Deltaproteobacteria bacterium]|nr:hypothetical protein [Deltaproteobacteria bacterium]MCW5801009.1 hypothetical protein [Deltaproteobacteria bacterium]
MFGPLVFLALAACAADGVDDPLLVKLPATSGTYAGRYRVPVAPELAAAADYAVDHVEWIVAGTTVTLHYDLPVGLVGGDLDVTFTGTLAPGATSLDLGGAQGVGRCTATATAITCREEFANLGALPISMDVVEQTAAVDYAGPVADRARVAVVFGSDPIGIVEIDLASPIVDDHGDD